MMSESKRTKSYNIGKLEAFRVEESCGAVDLF